jgi:hypothetical protein
VLDRLGHEHHPLGLTVNGFDADPAESQVGLRPKPLPGHPGPGCRQPAVIPVRPSADSAALYGALMDADDRGDAPALARLAWELFAVASAAEQTNAAALAVLTELATAARITTAASGSAASLAVLRDVLAKRGWLPPRDLSPLQVLAAPMNGSLWGLGQLIAPAATED